MDQASKSTKQGELKLSTTAGNVNGTTSGSKTIVGKETQLEAQPTVIDRKSDNDLKNRQTDIVVMTRDKQTNTWAGLFSHNRIAANGMPLTYILPVVIDDKPTVMLENEEV